MFSGARYEILLSDPLFSFRWKWLISWMRSEGCGFWKGVGSKYSLKGWNSWVLLSHFRHKAIGCHHVTLGHVMGHEQDSQRWYLFYFWVGPALFTNRLHKWLGSHFLTHPSLISLSPVSLLCYLSSPPHVAIPRGEKSLKQPILLMCRGLGHCWGDLLAQLRKKSLCDAAKSKPAPWGQFILVISAWRTLCKEASVHSGTWWPFLQRPSCLHCTDLKQAAQRNEEWYQDAKTWSYWEKTE